MAKTVGLDIPKLGGYDEFRVITQEELHKMKLRYVCSTYEGDGLENQYEADIYHHIDMKNHTQEYVALIN